MCILTFCIIMVQVGGLQKWRQLFVREDIHLFSYNKAIISGSELETLYFFSETLSSHHAMLNVLPLKIL